MRIEEVVKDSGNGDGKDGGSIIQNIKQKRV